jgi:hypothetical protein
MYRIASGGGFWVDQQPLIGNLGSKTGGCIRRLQSPSNAYLQPTCWRSYGPPVRISLKRDYTETLKNTWRENGTDKLMNRVVVVGVEMQKKEPC